jgi:hypothetical protein
VLAFGGWFCEIGKRDIYANSKIGLYALRKNITFTVVDNDSCFKVYPRLMGEVCASMVGLMARGKFSPITLTEYHSKNKPENLKLKTEN